jgi:hypothetical protein
LVTPGLVRQVRAIPDQFLIYAGLSGGELRAPDTMEPIVMTGRCHTNR